MATSKNLIILSIALFIYSGILNGQTERTEIRPVQYCIGLQPGLTVEPFDEFRNAFNFNLAPFSFEFAVNRHWAIRLDPRADLQVRPEFPAVMANVGAELAVPYYFSKKNSEEGHRGFYAAPKAGFVMDRLNNYLSVLTGAEIGYAFIFQNVLSISLGAVAGSEFQIDPENSFLRILPNTGGRICFGFWF